MTELFLAYAPRDRKKVDFIAEGLKKAGYAVVSGLDEAGEPKPIEEMALDMRRSVAFLPILTSFSAASDDFREMLRAGVLYQRHMTPVRLEKSAEIGVFAEDDDLLHETVFEEDPAGLTEALEKAVDLFPSGAATPPDAEDADEAADLAAAAKPRDITTLLSALKARGVTPQKTLAVTSNANENPVLDSLGLPKSTEAMLAHWRMVSENGSSRDLQRFVNDYPDDAYFTAMARDQLRGLQRKRYMRGALIGLDGLFGMLVVGVLGYGVLSYCADGGCDVSSLSTTRTQAIATAAPRTGNLERDLLEARKQVAFWQARAKKFEVELGREKAAVATQKRTIGQLNGKIIALQRELQSAQSSSNRPVVTRPQVQPQPVQPTLDPNPQLRADLDAARRRAEQLQLAARRAESEKQSLTNQLAALRQEMSRKDQQIAGLRNQPAKTVERVVTKTVPSFQPGADRAPGAASGGLAGAEQILIYYRDRLQAAARSGDRRPVLGPSDLKKLQACILKYTGALAKVDGVWGIETTTAMFTIDLQEADWVISCVRGETPR